MVIIQLSSIRAYQRLVFVLFLLVFCLLPFQQRIKGGINSFSKMLIPSDLQLPAYFSKSIYFYLSDPFLLLFVGILFFYFRLSWRTFLWEGPSKLLSLLFLTGFVSIILSKTAHYPLQYIRLLHFSFGFLLFNAVVSLQGRFDLTRLIASFAWTFLGIGMIEGSIALVQYGTQSALGLRFLGEMSLTHFPFIIGESPLYWGGPQSLTGQALRASGTFSHPNILGAFLFCSLFSTCYLYLKQEGRALRLGLAGALAFQLFALFSSFSRSALLAFVCSSLFFFFLLFKGRCKRVFSLCAATTLSCLVGLFLFYPALLFRGGIVNYNDLVRDSDAERIAYSKMAVAMVQENPFFGVGFNNFQLYSSSIIESMPGHLFHSKVHNIYLLIASEMGLIGATIFILFLFSVLLPSFRKLFVSTKLSQEKAFLLASFLGMLLMGCCDFFLVYVQAAIFIFFGLAALLYSISLRASER